MSLWPHKYWHESINIFEEGGDLTLFSIEHIIKHTAYNYIKHWTVSHQIKSTFDLTSLSLEFMNFGFQYPRYFQ